MIPSRPLHGLVLLACFSLGSCSTNPEELDPTDGILVETSDAEEPGREFHPYIGQAWIGNAVAYGPFRDGQAPGAAGPSDEQILEDLRIIAEHWNLIRMYGSEWAEPVLRLVREAELPIRVLVGAWLTTEVTTGPDGEDVIDADAVAANLAQVNGAIRVANEYPELVAGISVGNEIRVFWSDHKVQPHRLIGHVRAARAQTGVPVTVADDFNYWNKPESQELASELDFIVLHVHALWAGCSIEDALPWTQRIYQEISAAHPTKTVVIGEAGWATQKHTEGEQARLIRGTPSGQNQEQYWEGLRAWALENEVTTFWFEAFDENWKGGPHPDEVEKHWGVFRADRSPKPALESE
ncbi:MAG: glycosyl hydrolase family 17 protein [Planctomycetota bacterium]|nr:glycosyl hydrolase family 17 protein [Planctomycetota bacterium]